MSENFLVAFYGFLTIENIFTVEFRGIMGKLFQAINTSSLGLRI